MDKTSWIVIVGCVLILVFYQNIVDHFYPEAKTNRLRKQQTQEEEQVVRKTAPSFDKATPEIKPQEVITTEEHLAPEQIVTLENLYFKVQFTTHGGAIKYVILKKHQTDGNERITFNLGGDEPILNLRGWNQDADIVGYSITEQTDRSVTFQREVLPGLIFQRHYTLGEDDYQIQVSQTLHNTGTGQRKLEGYELCLGLGESIHMEKRERRYVGGSWYTESGQYRRHRVTEFDPSNFLFLFRNPGKTFIASRSGEKIRWGAVHNQFFVSVLSSVTEPGLGIVLTKKMLPEFTKTEGAWVPDAVKSVLVMPSITVDSGQTVTHQFDFYVGPKDNSRLTTLPFNQQKVMEFGWLGFISKPLLASMNFIYRFVHNYGIAIIIITIILRIILWYPQTRANQNMRKMQLVSPKLKELQEKYKDDPPKLQAEMMKLYKDYGVNPLGGCLPLFFQMPIFLGFYYMLLSAVELRNASFLWISDLSQPDTVAHLPLPVLGDIPINPMPLLMTASMFWTMHLSPQPKDVENPMTNIVKFMPLILLLICYNFSSALSLYWTMQNLLSAVQMYYNMKNPITELEKVERPELSFQGKKKAKKRKLRP